LKDIKKFGNSFFIGKEAGTSTDYTILQGFLEGSNVNPIREMVDLIQNQRAYESYANAIKSLDRINSKVINETLRA
jgi:flagellar basal-body rod protein FlgG